MTAPGTETLRPNDSTANLLRQGLPAEWLRWIEIIKADRTFLWRLTAVGTVLAAILAFSLPRWYTSTVSLMPPQTQLPAGLTSAVGELSNNPALEDYAGELLGAKSTGAMFVGVLQSRVVADALIDKYDLRKAYSDKFYFQARRELADNTGVSEDRKSGIITVSVNDKDKERARELAGEYVAQLNKRVVELNTSSAHQERVFLESRLEMYKRGLDKAIQDLSEYSSSRGTFSPKEQATAELTGAATLEGQVIVAESELQGLRQIYGAGNYRVKATEARVGELRHQLNKVAGTNMESPEGSPYPSLRELPLLGVRYQELYRDATVAEIIYTTLARRLELAKVEEAKAVPPVQVLDPPNLPEKHSRPHRGIVLLSGTVLALALGLMVLILDERRRRTGIGVDFAFFKRIFVHTRPE